MGKAAAAVGLILAILCLCLLWWKNSAAEIPRLTAEIPEPTSEIQNASTIKDGTSSCSTELTFIKELRERYQNEDIIGYLKIEGTTIDYPVVQSSDNEFYLKHDIYGDESNSGWVFLDYENDVARDERNTVIYGHNMKRDIMFHSLRYYTSYDFYRNHRYIIFNTIYEESLWEVFSFYKCNINFRYTQVVFPSRQDFYSLVSEMKEKSIYDTGVTVTDADSILTLSTCVSGSEKERYVLNAKKLKPEEVTDEIRTDTVKNK